MRALAALLLISLALARGAQATGDVIVPIGGSWFESTDCSTIIQIGDACWDTDNFTFCKGNGTTCVVQGGGGSPLGSVWVDGSVWSDGSTWTD